MTAQDQLATQPERADAPRHGPVPALRRHWPAAVVALAAVALVLLATRRGIGLSYDGVMYASTGRVLAETGEWHFTAQWPPATQVLVALVGVPGMVAVNALALVANLLVSYALALRVTGSRRASTLVTVWVAVAAWTVESFSMLGAEPFFVLLVNLLLLALVGIHRAQRLTPGRVALVVLACNLAAAFRYAGIALLPLVAVVLGASLWGTTRWLLRTLLVTAASALTMVALVAANLLAGNGATGLRYPPLFSSGEILWQLPEAVASFVVNLPHQGGAAGLVLLGAAVVALAAWARRRTLAQLLREPVLPVLVWLVGYLVFLMSAALRSYVEPLGSRMLAPVVTSGVLVAVVVLRSLLRNTDQRVVTAAAAVYLSLVAAITVIGTAHEGRVGLGLREDEGRFAGLSEVVDRYVPADAVIESNQEALFVWLTGRDLVRDVPDAGPNPGAGEQFWGFTPKPGDYVVWMRGLPLPHDDSTWVELYRSLDVQIYKVG